MQTRTISLGQAIPISNKDNSAPWLKQARASDGAALDGVDMTSKGIRAGEGGQHRGSPLQDSLIILLSTLFNALGNNGDNVDVMTSRKALASMYGKFNGSTAMALVK